MDIFMNLCWNVRQFSDWSIQNPRRSKNSCVYIESFLLPAGFIIQKKKVMLSQVTFFYYENIFKEKKEKLLYALCTL